MTYTDLAMIASRYGATVDDNVKFTRCKPQRRYKYQRHSYYNTLQRSGPRPIHSEVTL